MKLIHEYLIHKFEESYNFYITGDLNALFATCHNVDLLNCCGFLLNVNLVSYTVHQNVNRKV